MRLHNSSQIDKIGPNTRTSTVLYTVQHICSFVRKECVHCTDCTYTYTHKLFHELNKRAPFYCTYRTVVYSTEQLNQPEGTCLSYNLYAYHTVCVPTYRTHELPTLRTYCTVAMRNTSFASTFNSLKILTLGTSYNAVLLLAKDVIKRH